MTFYLYDAVSRKITGTANPSILEPYAEMLTSMGQAFLYVPGETVDIWNTYVNEDGSFGKCSEMVLIPTPSDMEFVDEGHLPSFEGLPPGAVFTPALDPFPVGFHQVRIQAPKFVDVTFTITVRSKSERQDMLLAYAANKRWELEQAGVLWNGHLMATDDRAKVMIMGSLMAAQMTPGWSTVWQFLDGTSARITAAEAMQMSGALQGRISHLFNLFSQVQTKISDGTITTPADIDAILI